LQNQYVNCFSNFGKNFLNHLKNAVFSWLTGSLTEVKLPETWDLKGIASVALQMVGISYQNIRKHLVAFIPDQAITQMENTAGLIKTLVTEGPMAAWEQLQEMAEELKKTFVDAVSSWIKETIIMKAIEFIASLIIPGAGIIKAIIGIYDTVVFFIQKAKDIAQMVGNFLGSIGEIAMGNIGAAANALENGLATALTLVISFLAKLIHLDGVTAKIRAALNKIRGKVENMMAKVAKWIAEKAKKLWGKMTGKDKKEKQDKKEIEALPAEERLKKALAEADELLDQENVQIESELEKLKKKYNLTSVKFSENTDDNGENEQKIEITVNPSGVKKKKAPRYPGSGLYPKKRQEKLWDDVTTKTNLPGESAKDKKGRIKMAKHFLLTYHYRDSLEKGKAQKILNHDEGQTIQPFQPIALHETSGAHTIDRHVLNGSGNVPDIQGLALRAFGRLLGAPGHASAFKTEGDATSSIEKALLLYGGGAKWPDFRKELITKQTIELYNIASVPSNSIMYERDPRTLGHSMDWRRMLANGYNGVNYPTSSTTSQTINTTSAPRFSPPGYNPNPQLFPGDPRGSSTPTLTFIGSINSTTVRIKAANQTTWGWQVYTSYPDK
jgi:hypothetical protein